MLAVVRGSRTLVDGLMEAGVFQFTFNPTETNIEARYRLLRFIGKPGVLTHREMAAAIDIGVGSIRNYLDKLMVEGFLEGLKSKPKISTEGLRLLNDFWPEEFSFTEQGRFVQSDDVPF